MTLMRINHLALRAIRELSGLSQSQTAHGSKIDRPNYAHIEAGRRRGTEEQIRRIAEFLRVPTGAIALKKDESIPTDEAA
jgi:transcriptional regulator with XRE-family HTH domain